MKNALFIGRFQPFHSGHLSVLQALGRLGYDQIIIGIGSAQYRRTLDNPLSLAEREQSLHTVLIGRKDIPSWVTVAIPDVNDDDHWVDHVDAIVKTKVSAYTATYTGNDWVKRLFEAAGKSVQPVEKKIMIDGTTIREHIVRNNPVWRNYVDHRIQRLIEQATRASHD
ncbi:MAG: adenylyltransferase/cytidyltransferase family protein [Candidatus Kerfeldbacteria bacterium]|nr:adenylyltransferase/cytidyltransferase family protein [Candidatus Kerfeldbacteria bacterium]